MNEEACNEEACKRVYFQLQVVMQYEKMKKRTSEKKYKRVFSKKLGKIKMFSVIKNVP